LRRRIRGTREIGIALALGHVLGAGESQSRHFRLREIVERRKQLERRKRAQHDVDFVALDQLLRLRLRAGRRAAGVCDQQLDLASGQREVLLLKERRDALFRVLAAGRKRTGFHGQQPDFHRHVLCNRRHRKSGGAGSRR